MFNGNINNRHYDNVDEYYRDLNELQRKGEDFTASCSYSTFNESSKEVKSDTTKRNDDVKDFINVNVIDFDTLYKEYLTKPTKTEFIDKLRNRIPYKLSEEQADRLKGFTEKEIEMVFNDLDKKSRYLESEKCTTNDAINTIDKTYDSLHDKRVKVYNELKEINNEVDQLLKKRDLLEDNRVMQSFLDSVYNDLYDILENTHGCDRQAKKEDKPKDKDTTSEDIIKAFKDMYDYFLA